MGSHARPRLTHTHSCKDERVRTPAHLGEKSRGPLVGALLLGAVACAVVLGSGAASGTPRGRRASPGAEPPSPAANARLARDTAARLLEDVRLPAGAKRVSADESVRSNLTGPASSPQHTAQLVGMHHFWRVREEPEAVVSWVEEHPPEGAKIITRGTSGKVSQPPPHSLRGQALRRWVREHTVTTEWDLTFAFPPVAERLATVWLSVSVAPRKGGGSAVRADAIVVWRQPRPAAEHIPSSVHAVRVHVSEPRKRVRFTLQIAGAKRLKAIIAVVEALQRPEGGASSCPADRGTEPVIELLFSHAVSTPPLVEVRIDDNGCGSVAFSREGRTLPPLGEAYEAVSALRGILRRRF